MIRPEYLRRLEESAYVDLYLSAVDGARVFWPWRMQPVHEASKRYRNACESYIIDSSFKDDSITNQDVLDTALEHDAEVAVLADVVHDMEATVEAILEGLDLADDHAYDGKIMIPLQAPHDKCYRRLEGQGDIYAVGGVKDGSADEKIRAAKSVREVAGQDIHLHGLGFGVTDRLVRVVRNSPELLDSVDYSSAVQTAMDGTVESGEERMSVVSARAGAQLVEDLRRLSPYTAGEQRPEDLRSPEETGLGGFTV